MKKDKENKVISAEQKTKKKSKFVRVLILVLVFATAVVGVFVATDLFFDDKQEDEPELVAVCVTSEGLILNDGEEVTLEQLRAHMQSLKDAGKTFVGSLINDTANPADVTLYNQVVDLFAEFGIITDKLPVPATADEVTPDEATPDEEPTTVEEATAETKAAA